MRTSGMMTSFQGARMYKMEVLMSEEVDHAKVAGLYEL